MAMVLIFIWGSFAAVSRLALNSLDVFQMQFYLFGAAFLALLHGRLWERSFAA